MSGPNQGFSDAVARFRADLSAAVTRAQRASAEGRETSAAFRRETQRLARRPVQAAERESAGPSPADPDDEDFSQHQILFHGG
ncbi:hypothetical protein [Actinokineospora enzanensis]|uniref:hypothetical protein n=1 Tax=Actinokineospora enzanensis TaxID=155975 RepID=UPI00037A2B92|nr:hypothetical protein [Actinokineospora enzanensis]